MMHLITFVQMQGHDSASCVQFLHVWKSLIPEVLW